MLNGMAVFISKDSLPAVRKVEAAPTGWRLYVWMQDGRSGMLDLSDWTGHPADKWEQEGFNHWRTDYGMACWGEDTHFSPDLCSEELIEMSYKEWLSSFPPVPA